MNKRWLLPLIVLAVVGVAYWLYVDHQPRVWTLEARGLPTEGICDVHHQSLERGLVPFMLGIYEIVPRKPGEEPTAAERLFPNKNDGPYLYPTNPHGYTHVEVLYCRMCRMAFEQWQREHHPTPNT